jgi:hypothetical protein
MLRVTLYYNCTKFMETKPLPSQKPKQRDPLYITIIILLLAAAGFCAYEMLNRGKKLEACSTSVVNMEAELQEMNRLLSNTLPVDELSKDIKENLQNMLAKYEAIETDNQDLADSVAAQREKIETLIAEVEKQKGNVRALYKYKKETEVLRTIMQGYVRTIDSLNTLTEGLKQDLTIKEKQLTDVTSERNKFKEESQKLSSKVEIGSTLSTTNVVAIAIRLRNSGKQVETTRAGRVDMVKTCFTINENKIANAGTKNIYMRVTAPDGKILFDKAPITIEVSGEQVQVSVKREIDYQNSAVDMCIYLDVNEDIAGGTYRVELFADKAKIGQTSFALK